MRIIFTKHVLERIFERGFTKKQINTIINKPEQCYHDKVTNNFVAIGTKKYGSKTKKISVFFQYLGSNDKLIITAHPESEKEIKNRINNGRYEPI